MQSMKSNPLGDIHRQAEAEFQNWADVEIVQTFGEPQAEYAAIRKACGLIDLPQRAILELSGKDRLVFLNNLLTNQTWDKATKAGLPPAQGVYAFLLNLKGRVVADMNVLERGDRTWLDMETRLIEPVRAVLDKYLFGEQVRLVSRLGELHQVALHGPGASELAGVTIDAPLQSTTARLFDVDVIVWRDDPCGVPGYHLLVPTESARAVWMNLIAQYGHRETAKRLVRPVGWAAFNACRIEAGRPVFGIDFDGAPVQTASPGKKDASTDDSGAGALPSETGMFDRAVSLTKGCYLGQEIVARMHARGQVARQICGIRMSGDALPIAGTQVLDEQSNPIGVITSSTISPVLSNAAICLGLVKRPHFNVGSQLKVPAEGAMREAKVVALPFVAGSGDGQST
jgi:folate-binding protein YgfZ